MLQRKTFFAVAANLVAVILAGTAHSVTYYGNLNFSSEDSQQNSGPVTLTITNLFTPTQTKTIENRWLAEYPDYPAFAALRNLQTSYFKLTDTPAWRVATDYKWDKALTDPVSLLGIWAESIYLSQLSYLYYREEDCPYCRFYNMVDDWHDGFITTAQLDVLTNELRKYYGEGPWDYRSEYYYYDDIYDWTSSLLDPPHYLYGGLKKTLGYYYIPSRDSVIKIGEVQVGRDMVYYNSGSYSQRIDVPIREGENTYRMNPWSLDRYVVSGPAVNTNTIQDPGWKTLNKFNIGTDWSISAGLNYKVGYDWSKYNIGGDYTIVKDTGFKAAVTPNDPLYASSGSWQQSYADQWALKRIGFKPMEDPTSAWNLTTGTERSIVVAVIDSGIDLTHPDLHIANIWTNQKETPGNGRDDDNNGYIDDLIGWNFVQNNNNPFDLVGHGTHVAGIIAARWNNGRGIAGINPGARIMPLKALNEIGQGWGSDIARAVVYAVDNGAQIINISAEHAGQTKFLERVFAYAEKKGALVVVSAGNEGADTKGIEPANQPGVLVVAATLPNDKRVGFSNWGEKVNIAAPGVDVLSLRAQGTDLVRNVATDPSKIKPGEDIVGKDEQYYRASGTSFAAPLVSGVASLMLAKNPNLTAEQIKRMLMMSADDIESPGWDQLTGYGMVNARKALEADPNYYLYAELHRMAAAREGNQPVIQAFGTVGGSHWGDYRIEIGEGDNPTQWRRAGRTVSGQIKDGQLGTLSGQDFGKPGRWTIRIVAQDAKGQSRESRLTMTLQ